MAWSFGSSWLATGPSRPRMGHDPRASVRQVLVSRSTQERDFVGFIRSGVLVGLVESEGGGVVSMPWPRMAPWSIATTTSLAGGGSDLPKAVVREFSQT